MIKPFLTYEQQLDKLVNEKHLIISDLNFAEEKLKEFGCFNIIGGYKNPFRNPMTRIYVQNTTFNDVYELYSFDSNLRRLFLQYLCQIERKVATSIAYAFCEEYGEIQGAYLDNNNYNSTVSNQGDISKLIDILKSRINSHDHPYIVYQRNINNNVPLWVLVNALTIGNISKMYSLLQSKIKSKVSHNFENVNEKELGQYLKVLVLYRNVCAHNERLFSHRAYSEIPNTILHRKLNITLNGNQYTKGKKDLFGVVIAFRYLLPRKDFLEFKKELIKIINKYLKKSKRLTKEELLDMMGFPMNWKNITKYRKI